MGNSFATLALIPRPLNLFKICGAAVLAWSLIPGLALAQNKVRSTFLGMAADGRGFYYKEDVSLTEGPKPEETHRVFFQSLNNPEHGKAPEATEVTAEFEAKKLKYDELKTLPENGGKPFDEEWGVAFELQAPKKKEPAASSKFRVVLLDPVAKNSAGVVAGKLNDVNEVKGVQAVYRVNKGLTYIVGIRFFENNILEAESVHYVAADIKVPLAELLRKSGLALVKAKKWKEAKARFDKSIELDSENSEALFQLAKIAALAGEMGEAFGKASHAIAVEPKLKKRLRADRAFAKLLKDKQFKDLLK